MTEHSKPKVKDWDLTLPDSIALSVFIKSIVDAAIMSFKAHTPNRAGLAHEVLPPAEHQQMFGFAAAPIPEPGDFFGTAAQMKNQQKIADSSQCSGASWSTAYHSGSSGSPRSMGPCVIIYMFTTFWRT